jgi:L-seryl-tRNA(Ser) seleniumtransferase
MSSVGNARSGASSTQLRKLPSVDDVMRAPAAGLAIERFGRPAVVSAVRAAIGEARKRANEVDLERNHDDFARAALARLDADAQPRLKSIFNLTGTVLHTNLGRALLAESAIAAATRAMREYASLEFDLATGKRGERDDHLRGLLIELTGAEDATVVNNNAAAVLLVLNSLARGKESIISRGELIEIGGAFRMPEIMNRAGTKLHEIGTTNRTHKKDYVAALGPKAGLVLKVHTSNYKIRGFVAEVAPRDLAVIANAKNVPFVHDLGSGTLVDLARWGLPYEPTVAEALKDGADIVTFSGDKLLGGPQTGFIVGRKDLIAQINRNPMKRALRVDKIRIAALEETLKLYRDPDRLAERLPTLRLLARPRKEIEALAAKLFPHFKTPDEIAVNIVRCTSQIGSGSLPTETLESAGISIKPVKKQGAGRMLERIAAALRRLPVPVIGRIDDDALVLDLRCLERADDFIDNLKHLDLSGGAS